MLVMRAGSSAHSWLTAAIPRTAASKRLSAVTSAVCLMPFESRKETEQSLRFPTEDRVACSPFVRLEKRVLHLHRLPAELADEHIDVAPRTLTASRPFS